MRIGTVGQPTGAARQRNERGAPRPGIVGVALLAAFVLTCLPAVAQAGSLTWSAAIPLEPTGGPPQYINGVACSSASQCTAVWNGQEVTFNPTTGALITGPTTITSNFAGLSAVACPSVSQCTAVTGAGTEVTFDPQSPGNPSTATVYVGDGVDTNMSGISCPSTTQCTTDAVFPPGSETTFNPQAPGAPTPVTLDPYGLGPVSCPTVTQCTSAAGGAVFTYNPQSPGTPTSTTIDTTSQSAFLSAISCPQTSQCTAVDQSGNALTFDPNSPGTPTPKSIDTKTLRSVSCVTVSQCTAVDSSGGVVTFDPGASGSASPTTIDGTNTLASVACPLATECVTVDSASGEVTFDPTAPGTPTPVTFPSSQLLLRAACPSSSQCTVVDIVGRELTFNPAAPGTPAAVTIDGTHAMSALACPSTTQCTALDGYADNEVTFNPVSGAVTSGPTAIDSGAYLSSLACPAVTQCTAVDSSGDQLTFNPQSTAAATYSRPARDYLVGVACPSTTQCTAVDGNDNEVTFDPTPPGAVLYGGVTLIDPTAYNSPSGGGLDGVACVSTTQCTAVDNNSGPPYTVQSGEVTFNPQSPGTPDANPLDPGRFNSLIGPACASAIDCVTVDGQGNAVEGNPAQPDSWIVEPIAGAGVLEDIACPSIAVCVTVDYAGNLFVGTRSTGVAVTCGPAPVTAGKPASCTATVSDRAAPPLSAPTGAVMFTSSGSGSLGAAACTLTAAAGGQASCQVPFSASAVGSGKVTASYPGDGSHPPSTGTTTVGVIARSTSASVGCTPGSVGVGTASSCTVTVTDTAAGAKSSPSGSVSFSTSGAGSFTGSGSCTLAGVGSGAASCQLSYAPSATGSGSHRITARYAGDAVHAASTGQASVGVTSSAAVTPAILRFGLTNSVFAIAPGGTPLSATAARAVRHQRGTIFLYTLSQAASVRIVIAQRLPGRRHGGRCVARSRQLRSAGKCTRLVVRGTLRRTSHQGANRVAFSGRIGSRPLKPGRYQATLVATSAAHRSSRPRTVRFVIVRR